MAKYDNEILLDLCSKIDLLEYASNSMDFDARGDSFATHCPLHIDKTPSLSITPSKNLFHCFSCGVGGNIINWMMTFEKLSFDEAVNKVSQLTGSDIKKLKQCDALAFYKSLKRTLEDETGSHKEINRKILDKSSIGEFKDEPPEEWIKEGIDPAIMKKYQIRIDDNSNRIVYPVYDADFNLIGFKGRTRYQNYKAMKIKKYLNYQKIGTTDFFIGMRENKESIIAHNMAIIFEGIKSGMKVEAWGYDYWLASETSYLNDSQVKILIQLGIRDVIIAYDNDVPLKKIKDCTAKLRKFLNVYVILDRKNKKEKLLGDKEEKLSPCDKGKEVWETLYKEKVKL